MISVVLLGFTVYRKSDVEQALYTFQKHVERMLDTKIKTVQSDWGGEYHRLNRYFAQEGITHRVTCPHTSQQNGIAERKHRHIVETGIALLAQSSLMRPSSLHATSLIVCPHVCSKIPHLSLVF